jgi:hypothetical protein
MKNRLMFIRRFFFFGVISPSVRKNLSCKFTKHSKPIGDIKTALVFDTYTANKLDLLFIFEKGIKKPHSFCCAVFRLKTFRFSLLGENKFFLQHEAVNKLYKF